MSDTRYVDCWNINSSDFAKQKSDRLKLEFLLGYTILSPSAHNTQPWLLKIDPQIIHLFADKTRQLLASDPTGRQMYLSLGCALETTLVAGKYFGLNPVVQYADVSNSNIEKVATITVGGKAKTVEKNDKKLFKAITTRQVNRSVFSSKKIPQGKQQQLQKVLKNFPAENFSVEFVTDKKQIKKIGKLSYQATNMAMKSAAFRNELATWLRHNWSKQPDGLPGNVLGMSNLVSLFSPALIKSDETIDGAAKDDQKLLDSAPMVIVVAGKDDKKAWLQSGQLLHQLVLTAESLGLAASYHTALIESPSVRKEIKQLLKLKNNPQAIIRVGYATKQYPHTPRRSVSEVLVKDPDVANDNPLLNTDFQRPHVTPQKENSQLLNWYQNYPIEQYSSFVRETSESDFTKLADEKALSFFHQVAEHVPAYKDFLRKNGIKHQQIETIADYKKVPIIDKKNYISQYSLHDLSWNGNLHDVGVISFSSGSSGDPYFWPRSPYQQLEGAMMYEHFMTELFSIDTKSSLMVVAFSMGAYVAGTYTLVSLQALQAKGYQMSIVSPGIDSRDSLRMIKHLAKDFDQVIFCGYPPFVKDLIEEGAALDINWKKMDVKFFFASEFFSETWREHVFSMVGKEKYLKDSTNIYGTADATVFGHETPLTILLRQLGQKDQSFHRSLFNSNLNPTFVQYNPLLRYFEQVDKELVLTAASGLPLVRYNLHDQGGILSLSDINHRLSLKKTTAKKLLQENNCADTLSNMPYVYINTRTDGAASLYGILIFPDYIKSAIEAAEFIDLFTGKFSLMTVDDNKNRDQKLMIHIELKQTLVDVPKKLHDQLTKKIVSELQAKSMEYKTLYRQLGDRALPEIVLHSRGEESFFKKKIKQRWIQNNG